MGMERNDQGIQDLVSSTCSLHYYHKPKRNSFAYRPGPTEDDDGEFLFYFADETEKAAWLKAWNDCYTDSKINLIPLTENHDGRIVRLHALRGMMVPLFSNFIEESPHLQDKLFQEPGVGQQPQQGKERS